MFKKKPYVCVLLFKGVSFSDKCKVYANSTYTERRIAKETGTITTQTQLAIKV